jgi:type IV pilus assembly protein PilC
MASAASKGIKEFLFEWEGKDRNGKIVRGETRAGEKTRSRPCCAARA